MLLYNPVLTKKIFAQHFERNVGLLSCELIRLMHANS